MYLELWQTRHKLMVRLANHCSTQAATVTEIRLTGLNNHLQFHQGVSRRVSTMISWGIINEVTHKGLLGFLQLIF